jgi:hypothetical protein
MNPHFVGILKLFRDEDVEFLVIAAHALAAHGTAGRRSTSTSGSGQPRICAPPAGSRISPISRNWAEGNGD